MTEPNPSVRLPTWAEQMRALEPVVDNLLGLWRPDGASEAEIQDMNKLALSMLASGYACRVYTDAKRPVFMPLWNYAYNQGGPDPDYVYSTAEIDATGTYRISGFRGTARFVEITEQTWDFLSPSLISSGGTVFAHDLDSLTLAGDGSFSVILSPQRPEGDRVTGGRWRSTLAGSLSGAAPATGATRPMRASPSTGSTSRART